jgi:hypothetical protein
MAADCRLGRVRWDRDAGRAGAPAEDPSVGLCACCACAERVRSARGSVFWRCRRADSDPRFRRYPPLPVASCPGYEEGTPVARERR